MKLIMFRQRKEQEDSPYWGLISITARTTSLEIDFPFYPRENEMDKRRRRILQTGIIESVPAFTPGSEHGMTCFAVKEDELEPEELQRLARIHHGVDDQALPAVQRAIAEYTSLHQTELLLPTQRLLRRAQRYIKAVLDGEIAYQDPSVS